MKYSASLPILFSVAALLAGSVMTVHGQVVLDSFNPNAGGLVRVIVPQPDGKILIGGDFTALFPNGGPAVTRNFIARLNQDGTVDTNFNPNANAAVYAIALQADGKILAGGFFSSIGGTNRFNMARLDATNGLADAFNPVPAGAIHCITVQPDGKILVGGEFKLEHSIGGQTRNHIARLDPATGLADSFNPNADGFAVRSIAVQADGRIVAGGDFMNIGGQARNFIARLDPTSGLADSFDPNADDEILTIAVQADGKILAGGPFTTLAPNGGASVSRSHIARFDTNGLADSFNPNANANVYSILVQADGKIVAGGQFSGTSSIGGQTRNHIARLDATTGLADSFDPNVNDVILAMALQTDGKILIGGSFSALAPNGGASVNRSRLARLADTPPPVLSIQRSGTTNVVLYWATNFTGFTLEANTNLTTNVWSTVSPAPAVSGTNNVVTNTTSGSTRFYRLRK